MQKQTVTRHLARFSIHVIIAAALLASAGLIHAIPPNFAVQLNNPGPLGSALNSQFGIAIAGTGKVVYVGAPTFDQDGTDSGAVFAFDQKTGAYQGRPSFGAFSAADNKIGTALAANKKYWIVGAPGTTLSANLNAGRVFILSARGLPSLYIDNPAPGVGDNFGAALALYKTLLVIGAPKDTAPGGGPAGSGAAYLVNLKTGLTLVGLIDPGAAAGDTAGASVAVSKDYIVVGAPGRQVGGFAGAGAVAVFDAKTAAYLGTLTDPSPNTDDAFGSAVAISGSLVTVGSPNSEYITDAVYTNAGAVFQFDAATRTLVRELPENTYNDGGHRGAAMATDGKLLIVGKPDFYYSGPNAGSTTTYKYKTGEAIRENISENPVAGGNFGKAVAAFKGGRYAVGEPFGQDTSGNIVGAAYMYNKYP
ncbi:MAG: hypothetical protein ACR2IE_10525 [Candidatus Sumerlaeaceae bacterium]